MNQDAVNVGNSFFKEGTNIHIHRSNEFPKYIGVLHSHPFIEISYLISGRAVTVVNGKEYAVRKGDVCVVSADDAHAFYPDTDCDEAFLTYDLMFTPDFIDSSCFSGSDFSNLSNSFLFYSLFPDEEDFRERFYHITGCNYELGSIFEKIYLEYSHSQMGSFNLIRLYTAEIIIKLLRRIRQEKRDLLSPEQRELVSQVIAYIEENYNMKIRTGEIASKLFFNKNYLAKLFKSETGRSIHEFLKEIRTQEAVRLLSTTKRTVAEIAADCGFSDMKTFYTAVERYTGFTPGTYRERFAEK